MGVKPRRSWRTLPPVTDGFSRIPDAPDGTRMVRCDKCGKKLPSLGIGYHLGLRGGRPCTERPYARPAPRPLLEVLREVVAATPNWTPEDCPLPVDNPDGSV